MKRIAYGLLGLASVAAAGPAAAQSGFIGAGFAQTEVEVGRFETERDGFFLEGAIDLSGPGSLGLEIEAGHADLDDVDSTGVAAHLYQNDRFYRIGGFVGLADAEDDTVLSIGAEGLRYFRDVTLGAALAYGTADDSDVDTFALDGEARYFVAPNVRLDGRLGWANADGPGGDADGFSVGAGGEFQLTAVPISLFGSYLREDLDDLETSSLKIGARFNWGGTLKDRDRAGVSLAGLSSLSPGVGW